MKKIFYFLYITAFVLFSCEKDETMLKMEPSDNIAPPSIVSQTDGFTKEVTTANRGEEIEFAWNETDYGISTEVSYTLEVTTGCGTFDNPIVLASSTNPFVTMTLEGLSAKLVNDLKVAPHELSDLQVRVTSTINGKFLSISEPVHISVSPWSERPYGLWIGEGAAAQVVLKKSGDLFESYRYIEAGTSFKFANNRLCADTFYGSSAAGILSTAGTSSAITITDAGYYKFNLDLANMTYQIEKITTWGLIGTATPGGWDNSTPMIYNPTSKTWEAELALTNGALKFRANNGWGINYGTADINDFEGALVFDAGAIDITSSGMYSVVLDFTQNDSPFGYTYAVSPLSDIPEPAALWLPGGYQGYNPGGAPKIYATATDMYEGYVYISSNTGYKFTSAPDWVHTNYGDGGTPGVLSTNGAAPDLSINQGYYKFNVNTADLTYTAALIETWGLIGTSTTGGWDVSTPMTYSQATNKWTITTNLAIGALKFRANNGWGINYGVADINALEGNLVFDAASADIKEAGSYTITLDFSKSASPYKYTYSIVKN